ncbi:hypothetical protein [Schaalia vaccimaxillae]|uniref:hypothetical protein n=1 Tax=Schaalia vaccimaxillae TaxID=183916 RepID=UPI0003B6E98A|nr:hypothetical protein [Schaalia vaccimaxillae]
MTDPTLDPPNFDGSVESVDTRPPALGLGRLVMVIYWVFGAWVTTVAVIDLFRYEDGPLGPVILALVAGLVYLAAALGLTHNGRRMRIIGWVCVSACLVCPIVLWIAGLDVPTLSMARSAWTDMGRDFYYLPVIVAIIGVVWMWWSNPRRIVELAEQVERPMLKRRS